MNSWETGKRIRQLNRNLNLLGGAGVCLLLGLIYACTLGPAMAESSRLSGLVAATEQFLTTTDEIARETRETQETSDRLESEMERILAGVPAASQESVFLGQISELVQGTSLKFEEFRPGKTTETGQYRQLEVQISGVGTYQDVCRFLAGLENLPRLCRVLRLQIETDADRETNSELSETGDANETGGVYPVSMTLVIFFAPPDALKAASTQNMETQE